VPRLAGVANSHLNRYQETNGLPMSVEELLIARKRRVNARECPAMLKTVEKTAFNAH
jgi:hypothetical protein